MSLLARSGGVDDEFTFTGGVAKNPAAVRALRELVRRELRRADPQHLARQHLHREPSGAAIFAQQECMN